MGPFLFTTFPPNILPVLKTVSITIMSRKCGKVITYQNLLDYLLIATFTRTDILV